jgi:hypothetical protein
VLVEYEEDCMAKGFVELLQLLHLVHRLNSALIAP